ncbi:MAG: uroporphyrinogen-III C-methyltransferase [Myxococcales bacterium FL481]|nr:MAG: uroporphyrinogen-III C-methyltransferase [Myxococcales bacterium FL481]
MSRRGKLILVGAGPGAADLLTIRALRAIQGADVVLFDRLVTDEVLELIPATVERVFVGKTTRRDADATQASIHELIVSLARAGRTVVRLKGGDPYVFGRGGEELLSAAAAGVAVEVVPGISASVAAPALAGIPVTMRGLSSSFAVFSGHEAASGVGDGIDWLAASRVGTAVFLMGVAHLEDIVTQLVAHGRAVETPVAVIEAASRDNERVVVGTLSNIRSRAAEVRPPATIVVGAVVDVRRLAAFVAPVREHAGYPAAFQAEVRA